MISIDVDPVKVVVGESLGRYRGGRSVNVDDACSYFALETRNNGAIESIHVCLVATGPSAIPSSLVRLGVFKLPRVNQVQLRWLGDLENPRRKVTPEYSDFGAYRALGHPLQKKIPAGVS